MELKQMIGYLAIFSIIQSIVAYSDISQEGSLLEENSPFKAEILTSHNAGSNLSVLIGNNKFTFVMGNQYDRELMWKQYMEKGLIWWEVHSGCMLHMKVVYTTSIVLASVYKR